MAQLDQNDLDGCLWQAALCCAVFFHAVLCCSVLCCSVLFCAVLCCSVLAGAAPFLPAALALASRLWVEAGSSTPCGSAFPIRKDKLCQLKLLYLAILLRLQLFGGDSRQEH